MSITALASVRTRLRTVLADAMTAAGRPDVGVSASAIADLADGPVVFTGGARAEVEAEYVATGAGRWGFTWSLDVMVHSRRYHPSASAAEDEVAAVAAVVFAALAAAPELEPDPVEGLEWIELGAMALSMGRRPEPVDGQPIGADQWEADATITLTVRTRETA